VDVGFALWFFIAFDKIINQKTKVRNAGGNKKRDEKPAEGLAKRKGNKRQGE
jgi:hypothetical protein